jgi:hypothetical protein
MKNNFNKLINKYGYRELFYIFLYPIFLPLLMLKDTSFSIFNIIKSLLKYDWRYLSGNDQANAYNNLFYYVQDFNIQKFGRYGKSNFISNTDFSFKKWFHVTPFSLRLQSSFGTTFIMFFAMCFWLLSWIILYQDNSSLWLILGVVFFSTLFFAVFIEIQNYNILGWMLFPIFLTYLVSGDYLTLSLVLFLIALSSFTAFIIAGILVTASSIYTLDYYILFTLIPAGIKWIIPIIYSLKSGALMNIFAGIGGHDKVKYSRKKDKSFSVQKVYALGLVIQFLCVYLLENSFSIFTLLLIIVICLFVINEFIMRFADNQSFYILYLSVSVISLLTIDTINNILFLSYVLSIYPIYGLIRNVKPRGDSFIAPSARNPYNIKNTIIGLEKLFEAIPKNSKLIMAYKNPKGQYSNIFNGYRIFNEPIHFAATINNISYFPTWYTVFENNKEDSKEDFWINDCQSAINYMHKNCIDYLLVPSFLEEFNCESFSEIGKFRFKPNKSDFNFNSYSIRLFKILPQ